MGEIWTAKKSIDSINCASVCSRTAANRIAECFQWIEQIISMSRCLHSLAIQSLIKEVLESLYIFRVGDKLLVHVD